MLLALTPLDKLIPVIFVVCGVANKIVMTGASVEPLH